MAAYKQHLKDLFFATMYRLGIAHPKRIGADRWLILTFHRVLPEPLRNQYPLPGLAVTPETLRWIIESLMPYFEILPVTEGGHRQRTNERVRPLLSITFDDGQLDNLEYAAPVLADLGVRATFYLPTDFIGIGRLLWHDEIAFAWNADRESVVQTLRELQGPAGNPRTVGEVLGQLKRAQPEERRAVLRQLHETIDLSGPDWAQLMSWQDAAALASHGHEIGSHSQSHELLPQLDAQWQEREITGSKKTIASRLAGMEPGSFCYPNGDYSATTASLVEKARYENAVTTRWGINGPEQSCFELLRCDMDMRRLRNANGRLSDARLAVKVTGHQPGL